MQIFRENIWKENEYTYEAAYGFVPNLMAYLHEDGEDAGAAHGDASSAGGRPCMIVLPGGGYCMVVPPEGEVVAKEFYERGMNCFVLTYTTDITMSVPLKTQPMEDASRAVRYVRKNASRFGIDASKIVLCGFSAAAHMGGSLGVHFKDVKDPDPELDAISNRPDGLILSYPVITAGEYTHIYSIQALIGKDASETEREYFSLEKNVTSDTPPCFIWQTVEDSLVPVENSMMFAEACRKAGVPYTYHAFPNGDHGLSVHNLASRKGEFGEWYTMEQVMKAVDAVREGKGVRVSEQRRNELIEQFSEPMPEMPEGVAPEFKDVAMWPDLAQIWMESLWRAQ